MSERGHSYRSILITGASSGIGEALARLWAAPGVTLTLSGRDTARLGLVAEACRRAGATVAPAAVDVTDWAGIAKWIAESDDADPLDLVVANAGIGGGTGGAGEDEEQVRAIFAVNVDGVLNTVLPVIPRMRARRRGQIAIVSSLAGFIAVPGAPAYCASKFAVRAWGEGLRGWLAEDGVGVSVVCPGYVTTRMTEKNEFPMPLLMTADKAAGIIAHGIARNRGRIVFPWPLYALIRLVMAIPNAWLEPLMRRLPRKG